MTQGIKKYSLISLGIIGVLFIGRYTCQKQKEKDKQIQNETLQKDEKEKVVLDQRRHQIKSITSKGIRTGYLNSRGPISITESISGILKTQERTWGFEKSIGIGFSGDLDLHYNWFYWHNIDTSIGVSSYPTHFEPNAFVGIGYNFYGDGILYVKYTTKKQIKVGLEWRIF